MAIRNYLQAFGYTRDLPATAAQATLDHFLFERQEGHCEYFSTAMVVLLRSVGIHARSVNGFLGGQWSDFGNYLVVTQNEAHSWVEVWFPRYGWVAFDPTPAGVGSTALFTSWFWPGRILFDVVQHRWNKWVLDYSIDDQVGIFSGLFGGRSVEQIVNSDAEQSGPSPWGAAVMILVVVIGYLWARRGAVTFAPATHMYVQLQRTCSRAGLGITPGLTPLALVEQVRAERSSAGRAAERVVDLYLRARYGGEALGESELREMREALGVARKTLKARPS